MQLYEKIKKRYAFFMTRSHAILTGPLVFSLLATAFCVWSALGNDVNFCVTTGCTLYQDFTVAGISLWWIGTGSFICLCACALLGQIFLGRLLSGIFLLGDICLLALMSVTAPCVSCMVAAFFFALSYFFFRRASFGSVHPTDLPLRRKSPLLIVWSIFFIINLALVCRSQLDIWPIFDESGEPRIRMFFSPSCPYCVEGVNVLSGNVDVAFYPVAENDDDVFRLAKMIDFLADGMSMAEALGQSLNSETETVLSGLRPHIMLLRFRLLRNKAYLFASGSQGVPFFEYKGLPPDIVAKIEQRKSKGNLSHTSQHMEYGANLEGGYANPDLPAELTHVTQCGGSIPCPPATTSLE